MRYRCSDSNADSDEKSVGQPRKISAQVKERAIAGRAAQGYFNSSRRTRHSAALASSSAGVAPDGFDAEF